MKHKQSKHKRYIGHKDQRGNKIYTGDRVNFTFFFYVGTEIEIHKIGIIGYKNKRFTFSVNTVEEYYLDELTFDSGCDIEAINNED